MYTAADMKPRHGPGGRYCAPFCGRGCTKREHDEAVRKATALAARLGAGWESYVSENLGWYYGARRKIRGQRDVLMQEDLHAEHPRYTLYVNGSFFGGDTPQAAIDAACKAIQAEARRLSRLLSSMTGSAT